MTEQEQKYKDITEIMRQRKIKKKGIIKLLKKIDNYPPAQFIMAVLIQGKRKKSRKADVLLKEALPYYLATNEDDDAERLARLGSYYHFGLANVKQDFSEAYKWFLIAAEKNDPKAQLCLSRYYANGTVVEKDMAIALSWIEKAAAQNDPEGLYALGHCYAGGHGVEKDLKKAEELLKKAISFGSKKAFRLYRTLNMANYFS